MSYHSSLGYQGNPARRSQTFSGVPSYTSASNRSIPVRSSSLYTSGHRPTRPRSYSERTSMGGYTGTSLTPSLSYGGLNVLDASLTLGKSLSGYSSHGYTSPSSSLYGGSSSGYGGLSYGSSPSYGLSSSPSSYSYSSSPTSSYYSSPSANTSGPTSSYYSSPSANTSSPTSSYYSSPSANSVGSYRPSKSSGGMTVRERLSSGHSSLANSRANSASSISKSEGYSSGGDRSSRSSRLGSASSGGGDSASNSRPETPARSSLASENGEIDYKKLYEESQLENDRLRGQLKKTEDQLTDAKSQIEKVSVVSTKNSLSELEKRERRAMERKLSEMEEELKQMEQLKSENQRLKDENGALIRVISKLSK